LSLDFDKLIKSLRQQKAKYHSKVLSEDAIEVNLFRAIDIEAHAVEWAWQMIPQYNYATFGLAIIFDIPPIELEPMNVEFKVELPSWNELLQGILIKTERFDLSEEYPWLKETPSTIFENYKPEYAYLMAQKKAVKGVYDQTPYDISYYDPTAVRDFLRSTFQKLYLERKTFDMLAKDIKDIADKVQLNLDVARTVFSRIASTVNAQRQSFILGYSVLGLSFLSRRGSEEAKVLFTDLDGKDREIGFKHIDHLQLGFYLGLTTLGYGYLVPREVIHKMPKKMLPTGFSVFGAPSFVDVVLRKVLRFRDTFAYNAFSFANYNKWEEQRSYHLSERADQWFRLQLLRYHLENIALGIARRYEDNPVKLRMYKSAVLQLLGYPAKRHKWGYKVYSSMSDEEFKSWWLEHWKKQGLNEAVLLEIYERIKEWIKTWRIRKLEEGIRVRERRYQLAQALK